VYSVLNFLAVLRHHKKPMYVVFSPKIAKAGGRYVRCRTRHRTSGDDLLVSTGKSKEALEQELSFLLAVKLFELFGYAAKLRSLTK
jgi:hypothetical protein